MTAALNEATSRLKSLESNNRTTTTAIADITKGLANQKDTLNQQGNEIKALSEAYQTQNNLITALQTTQIQ